jgi:primosomal protein N'
MYIIDVVPIAKGVPFPFLSYFSQEPVPYGQLVTITIKGRGYHGVAVVSAPLSSRKSAVKSASFMTKGVSGVHTGAIPPALLRACEETSNWFITPLHDVLDAVLPEAWLSVLEQQERKYEDILKSENVSEGYFGPFTSRIRKLETRIETMFESKQSVVIVCPTTHGCDRIAKALEQYEPIVLHSAVSKKNYEGRAKLLNEKNDTPRLLIITPRQLGMTPNDTGLFIIEDESHPAWREHVTSPHIDFRMIVSKFASGMNVNLLHTGWVPSMDAMRIFADRPEQIAIEELSNLPAKAVTIETPLVKLDVLTDEAKPLMKETLDQGRILIIAARKGFAPITICLDCDTPITCPTCGSAMSLIGNEPSRAYVCRHCRTNSIVSDQCATCGGWKLVPRGYGIERITELLQKTYGTEKVATLSNEEKLTRVGKKIISDWQDGTVPILVATPGLIDMADTLLPNVTVVASLESLRSGFSFRQNETLSRSLALLSEFTNSKILAFHAQPSRLLDLITTGNASDFASQEWQERTLLGLPPATVAWNLTGSSYLPYDKTAIARAVAEMFPEMPPKITLVGKSRQDSHSNAFTLSLTFSQDSWSSASQKYLNPPLVPDVTWHESRVQPETLI